MSEQTTSTSVAGQITNQVVGAWTAQEKRVTDFFNKHADDVYMNEVAPGRNRAIYLLGHFIAVNDGMLPLLGLGDKLYPQLEAAFLTEPDKAVDNIPTIPELKEMWQTLHTKLSDHFGMMSPQDWLGRHTKVSEEDFAKEPHRNKLSILLSRTNHESYHLGQLAFLAGK